jgi:hypothetical protein
MRSRRSRLRDDKNEDGGARPGADCIDLPRDSVPTPSRVRPHSVPTPSPDEPPDPLQI